MQEFREILVDDEIPEHGDSQRDLPDDKNMRGPRAGDAMVEPFLVLKILVT